METLSTMNLLSAAEADKESRENSKKELNPHNESILRKILDQVQEAVDDGAYSCETQIKIEEPVRKTLEKLGYTVRTCQLTQAYTRVMGNVISW